MTDPTTDHDLLIHVSNDVSHLRDDVAGLSALLERTVKTINERDETRETRIRVVETTQTKHGTRWRFFGWALAILSAFGGIVGLIAALT